MKKFLLGLTILILFLLQTSIDSFLKIYGIAPNLLLVFCVVYSVNASSVGAIVVGCVSGLLTDSACGGIIGINALIFTYISFIVCYISSRKYYKRIYMTVATVFVVSFVYEIIHIILWSALYAGLPIWHMVLRYVLPVCIYNAFISVILKYPADKLKLEYIRGI